MDAYICLRIYEFMGMCYKTDTLISAGLCWCGGGQTSQSYGAGARKSPRTNIKSNGFAPNRTYCCAVAALLMLLTIYERATTEYHDARCGQHKKSWLYNWTRATATKHTTTAIIIWLAHRAWQMNSYYSMRTARVLARAQSNNNTYAHITHETHMRI